MDHHSFLIKSAIAALPGPALSGAAGPGFLTNVGYGVANLLRRMGWSTPKKWLLSSRQHIPAGFRGAAAAYGPAGIQKGYSPLRRGLADERARQLGMAGLGAGAAGLYGGYKWMTTPPEEVQG